MIDLPLSQKQRNSAQSNKISISTRDNSAAAKATADKKDSAPGSKEKNLFSNIMINPFLIGTPKTGAEQTSTAAHSAS